MPFKVLGTGLLSSKDAVAAKAQEPASEISQFRFDDATPNAWGKVVWDTDEEGWKVSYRVDKDDYITYQSDCDEDLRVRSELDADAYLRAKDALYWKFVEAWNKMDKSTSWRILHAPEFSLLCAGSSSETLEMGPYVEARLQGSSPSGDSPFSGRQRQTLAERLGQLPPRFRSRHLRYRSPFPPGCMLYNIYIYIYIYIYTVYSIYTVRK